MAEQLLKIETVPISFEYVESKHPASLSKSVAKLEITRENNALDIKSEPVQFKMDSFSANKGAVSSNHLSYTATAGYDIQGRMTLNVNLHDQETNSFRFAQIGRSVEGMAATVNSQVVGSGEGEAFRNYFPLGESNISISFDLSGIRGIDENSTFTPPDLELEVTERPHVVITYVGGPIYFPKSADPNYEPPADGTFAAEA